MTPRARTQEERFATTFGFRIRGMEMGIETYETRVRYKSEAMSEAIYQIREDMKDASHLIKNRGVVPTAEQLKILEKAQEVIKITRSWKSYRKIQYTKAFWSGLRREIRENRKENHEQKHELYGIIVYKLREFTVDAAKHVRKNGKVDSVDVMLITEFTYRTIDALNKNKLYLFKSEKRLFAHTLTDVIRRMKRLGLEQLTPGLATARNELARRAY